MLEDIKKIIADGTLAPSGENCQPWRFLVKDTQLRIFNIPQADQSLYNFNQKGSYVAHGALLENISISAAQHGYSADIKIFPQNSEANLVSTVTFNKTSPQSEVLYPYLEKRCTNRKDHRPVRLSDGEKSSLVSVARESAGGELKIIDDQKTLDILGPALAVNEHVLFENKKLHDFFYGHIFWDKEDEDKAGGFYVKTLEFLPHQLKAVKLFKNWNILNFLNRIAKVSQKIAKENGEKYARSGALAAVVVPGNNGIDFVNAGRTAERVWLAATKLGLSVQPCTGVLYFMERIRGGDSGVFSPAHVKLIQNAYVNITKAFNVQKGSIPMLFRIGHADEPTARSLRMKADISIL